MFFRNLKLYRLESSFPDAALLAEKLAAHPLQPCGGLDAQSFGWIPPRGIAGEYVVSVNGHLLISLGIERKILPGTVVRREVDKRVKKIEEEQARKLGRKEKRDITDQVTSELLPNALSKPDRLDVWVDAGGRWLGVNSTSAGRIDEFVSMFIKSVGAAAFAPPETTTPAHKAMTAWLLAGEVPGSFTIDQDCELQEVSEQKATVRFMRHNLDAGAIREHIESGKRVTKLALTWNDRISFVLNEDMSIKRLSFLDILKEEAAKDAGESDLFESDLAIMGGELRRLANDLIEMFWEEKAEAA